MADLKDMPHEELISFGTREILEQVLGGKKSLRAAVMWIVDVASRWGYERKMKTRAMQTAIRNAREALEAEHGRQPYKALLAALITELNK